MTARLTISAGSGPWEVRRFVALLADEVEARCVGLGFAVAGRARTGPEDAPRSVTLEVDEAAAAAAPIAGWLGTHELRAASPHRSKRSRQRWFAAVTLATGEEAVAPSVRRADVVVRTCRASGPGGQHVNTASTAVQVWHRPTWTRARASDERSQAANLKLALARLERALAAAHVERERARAAAGHVDKRAVERGRAVLRWGCDAGWRTLTREEG